LWFHYSPFQFIFCFKGTVSIFEAAMETLIGATSFLFNCCSCSRDFICCNDCSISFNIFCLELCYKIFEKKNGKYKLNKHFSLITPSLAVSA